MQYLLFNVQNQQSRKLDLLLQTKADNNENIVIQLLTSTF